MKEFLLSKWNPQTVRLTLVNVFYCLLGERYDIQFLEDKKLKSARCSGHTYNPSDKGKRPVALAASATTFQPPGTHNLLLSLLFIVPVLW